jgi:serine/threonine protein phosphatase PrpC
MNYKGNPWRTVTATVTGASHIRKWLREQNRERNSVGENENDMEYIKALNQDRVNISHGTPVNANNGSKTNPTVVAVSDGHGGAKYIRSGIGAGFAVLSACRMATLNLNLSNEMRGADIEQVVSHIKTRVLDAWFNDVDDYTIKHPFKDEEFVALSEKARKDLAANPRKAYGCTLLWVVGYNDLIITFQLGDGNIILLYEDGRVESTTDLSIHEPGEETESLCTIKSPHEIQHQIFRSGEQDGGLPVLVAISSDGLYKSYEHNEDFLKIPQICLETLKEKNFNHELVESTIKDFLHVVTEKGAGDDTTLGIMYNTEKLSSKAKPIRTQVKSIINAKTQEAELNGKQ